MEVSISVIIKPSDQRTYEENRGCTGKLEKELLKALGNYKAKKAAGLTFKALVKVRTTKYLESSDPGFQIWVEFDFEDDDGEYDGEHDEELERIVRKVVNKTLNLTTNSIEVL